MLEFLTLFIALVTGPRDIELAVDAARLARVELTLDGQPCATLEEPPWVATCDFGPLLVPHRLEAVGYGADGAELARAVQHVNVPGEPAEAALLVERDEDGRPVRASVRVSSAAHDGPNEVTWRLDDEILASGAGTSVELPRLGRKGTHVLEATLRFGHGESLRVVRPVGRSAPAAGSDAAPTGLVLRAASPSDPVDPGALGGTITAGGDVLDVRGVELGAARVVLVIDPADLSAILERWTADEEENKKTKQQDAPARGHAPLGPRESFFLMWPYWEGDAGKEPPDKLYSRSQGFTREHGGIDYVLRFITAPSPPPPAERYSVVDAVAVAGRGIAGSGYRRAVVVLLSSDRASTDDYAIDEVREFLAALGVPLFAWRLPGVDAPAAWGDVAEVGSLEALQAAVLALTDELRAQRVVWVEGRHLLHEVEVAKGAPVRAIAGPEPSAAR